MTVAFYKLTSVIPFEEAEKLLKEDVKTSFGKKSAQLYE